MFWGQNTNRIGQGGEEMGRHALLITLRDWIPGSPRWE